jgi:uncharacterized membrane protein
MAKSSTGMEENVAGLLCYLAGWITGIIFLVIEKDSKFVKYHAIQSIVVFGAITILFIIFSILGIIPGIGFIFSIVLWWILWVIMIVLWIILMVKAYQGKKINIAGAGGIASKHS